MWYWQCWVVSVQDLADVCSLLLLLLLLQANGDEDGGDDGSRSRQRPAPELEDTGVVGERAMGRGRATTQLRHWDVHSCSICSDGKQQR
jgi:hypothetical protein